MHLLFSFMWWLTYVWYHVFQLRPKSPFAQFNEVLLDNKDSTYPNPTFQEDLKVVDNDVLNMEPQTKARPR